MDEAGEREVCLAQVCEGRGAGDALADEREHAFVIATLPKLQNLFRHVHRQARVRGAGRESTRAALATLAQRPLVLAAVALLHWSFLLQSGHKRCEELVS